LIALDEAEEKLEGIT